MRVKTQAISINEETYPIAVACLPGGFADIPFENVDGCWLIINSFGLRGGDEYNQPGTGLENIWVTGDLFAKQYKIINRKTGALSKSAWYPVEKAFDEDLAKQLNGEDEYDGFPPPRVRRFNKFHHLPGHRG